VAPLLILVQLLFLHLLGGGVECSASEGGDLVSEMNQNISALLEDVILCLLGRTPDHQANSCAELAKQEPDIPSGNYWILNSTQSPVQVFCEMGDAFPASLNVTGSWVRVANLNMTDPDQQVQELTAVIHKPYMIVWKDH